MYIPTLTLAFILLVAIAIGAYASYLVCKTSVDEEILAEACDKCHWTYVAETQDEQDAKCEQCLIGRVRK